MPGTEKAAAATPQQQQQQKQQQQPPTMQSLRGSRASDETSPVHPPPLRFAPPSAPPPPASSSTHQQQHALGLLSAGSREGFEITECPREISCFSDESFYAHAAFLLLCTIQKKLEESAYTKVVVGLSGGSTPGPIYARLRQLDLAAGAQRLGGQQQQQEAAAAGAPAAPATAAAAGAAADEGRSSSTSSLPSSYASEAATPSPRKRGLDKHTDWSRVYFFLVDERYVDPLHADANQRLVREQLLGQSLQYQQQVLQQQGRQKRQHQQAEGQGEQQHQQEEKEEGLLQQQQEKEENQMLDIPEENLFFPDTTLPLEECVEKYRSDLLRLLSSTQQVDLVTLGLGPDGHFASIFPPLSDKQLQQQLSPDKIVLATQTDRFTCRDRITVSLHLICSAQNKFFFLRGVEKVKLWRKMLSTDSLREMGSYPALAVVQSGHVRVVATPPLDESEEIRSHDAAAAAAEETFLSCVILGASGDLAKHKTYPALFSLFCEGFLPKKFHIIGYARTPMTFDVFWQRLTPGMESLSSFFGSKAGAGVDARDLIEDFKSHCSYMHGQYDDVGSFERISEELQRYEKGSKHVGRLLYLALPPQVFIPTVACYKKACWNTLGWNRVVVEKPFGRDSESSAELSRRLVQLLREEEIYRMDHYLGKEMALSLMSIRFANMAIMPLFHRNFVRSVRITFKEEGGTMGRGGYFDEYGIIRDVMQNHMTQLLTLTAMDRPATLDDDDVRDEKVKVLKQMPPIKLSETVLGQFVASEDGKKPGYKDDETVPKDSRTATFCTAILWVNNERWCDVPFIFKAGKALESKKTEVRLQLREAPAAATFFGDPSITANELVIQVQPREAVYLKMYTKKPGLSSALQPTELDLSVLDRFDVERLPDAYERLILDVIKGNKQNFVRTDELREAWRIFTPLLHEIDDRKIVPLPYAAGSSGPKASYDLIQRFYSYKKNDYRWSPPATSRR